MQRWQTHLGALALAIAAPAALAQQSDLVGGSGGTVTYALACASGERMTGLGARYGTVIERIRIRCTPISSTDGGWASSNHSWSNWTTSDAPQAAPSTTDITCGNHSWVRGVRGHTVTLLNGNRVLAALELACHGSNNTFAATGSALTTPMVGATGGGQWSAWTSCPSNGLARGASGRRGWYVDNLRLACADPLAAPAAPAAPTAAPGLVNPRWNSAILAEYTASYGNRSLVLQTVSGASRYQLCVRDGGGGACWIDTTRAASTGAPTAGGLGFTVNLPASKAGTLAEWTARGCSDANVCGPWATAERFAMLPVPPMPTAPPHQGSVPSRQVHFSWNAVASALAGYQLEVYRQGSASTELLAALGAGTTSHTLTLPDAMGNQIGWRVRSCASYDEKGMRCSVLAFDRLFTVGGGVAASFSSHLLQTYQHARCTTCHGMNASPSTKPNHNLGTTCSSCHNQGGAQNWHAPAAHMDFRNKSAAQLCDMTRSLGTNVAQHLKNDTLILWAVNSGQLPNGTSVPKAPPGSTSAWHQKVDDWIAGGMSCH